MVLIMIMLIKVIIVIIRMINNKYATYIDDGLEKRYIYIHIWLVDFLWDASLAYLMMIQRVPGLTIQPGVLEEMHPV